MSTWRDVEFSRDRDGILLVHRWVWKSLRRNAGYLVRDTHRAPIPPVEEPKPRRLHERSTANPRRITLALDACALYGPEVDEALGVREPTVDAWESGVVTPTSVQVDRLARLTGYPSRFFYEADPTDIRNGWMCGSGQCRSLGSYEPLSDLQESCVVFQ